MLYCLFYTFILYPPTLFCQCNFPLYILIYNLRGMKPSQTCSYWKDLGQSLSIQEVFYCDALSVLHIPPLPFLSTLCSIILDAKIVTVQHNKSLRAIIAGGIRYSLFKAELHK